VSRRLSGRAWKLIGLAGLAGVAATGVALARDERRRRAYTSDEIRDRLRARHAEALATAPAAHGAGPASGRDADAAAAAAKAGHRPDPARAARCEAQAWTGYYRREWWRVLRGTAGMVREGFGTTRAQTLRGAWWVLRANQAWAPSPDNDPDAARALMTRFYRMAASAQGLSIDPAEAARREVAWWQAHRDVQAAADGAASERLITALAELYAYVYSVPVGQVHAAAAHRAAAMGVSDAWVADGARAGDPRLADVEAELVRKYTAQRDALGG